MKLKIVLAAALFGGVMTGCMQAEPLSQAEIAALPAEKARWLGTFAGTWGGTCTGSLTVLRIDGDEAAVGYTWGFCGNSHQGSAERVATFVDDALKVNLWGRTAATYRFIDQDTIEGSFVRPRDGVTATGQFTRVVGQSS